jgi:hypothetical protein
VRILRHADDDHGVAADGLLHFADDLRVTGFHDGERRGRNGAFFETETSGHGMVLAEK